MRDSDKIADRLAAILREVVQQYVDTVEGEWGGNMGTDDDVKEARAALLEYDEARSK